MIRRLAAGITAIALTASMAGADEPQRYRVAFERATKVGDRHFERFAMTVEGRIELLGDGPRAGEVRIDQQRVVEWTREIVGLDAGGDVSAERLTFHVATMAIEGSSRELPFQGQSVDAKHSAVDDTWGFRVTDGEKPLDAALLRQVFGQEGAIVADRQGFFAPGKPVAVGERWPIDTAELARRLAGKDAKVTGKDGELTLARLVERPGGARALIEGAFTVETRSFGPLSFGRPVEATIRVSLETSVAPDQPASSIRIVLSIDEDHPVPLAGGRHGMSIRPEIEIAVTGSTRREAK